MFPRHPLIGVLIGGLCLSLQSVTPAADPAKTFQVNTDASRVFIKVGSAMPLGHSHGIEGRITSGTLTPGGNGELVFDMASFTADTPESRRLAGLDPEKISPSDAKKITDTMHGPEVLDIARFPTATFRINTIIPLDHQPPGAAGTYQLTGPFTLHGTENDLQINATLHPSPAPNDQMTLTGSFTIKQRDYGIKPYSTLGGVVKVSDKLEITGDLVLTPEAK